jgi:hypothetical protein
MPLSGVESGDDIEPGQTAITPVESKKRKISIRKHSVK